MVSPFLKIALIVLTWFLAFPLMASADYTTTDLRIAIQRQDHEKAKKIIESKQVDVNAEDDFLDNPTHKAACWNSVDILALILKAGGNPNAVSHFSGLSSIFPAISGGRIEHVGLLLQHGANPNKFCRGISPLHEAVFSTSPKRQQVIDLLLKTGSKVSDIFIASGLGDIEKVKAMIEEDPAEVLQGFKPLDKMTALHFSARAGSLEVTQYLIKHGAEVNAKTTDNETPLHEACWNGKLEIVKFLLDSGADLEAQYTCTWSKTPLHISTQKGYFEITKLLVDKGANVNVVESVTNNTPLHNATSVQNLKIAELLLSKGAKVNLQNTQGNTPLHETYGGASQKAIVNLLLQYGAKVNIKNERGKTPLDFFKIESRFKDPELIQILTEASKKEEAPSTKKGP